MGKASVSEGKNLKQLLDKYGRASGQLTNNKKSSLFFFNTPVHRQIKIARILGCRVDSLPATYLGLPLSLKPPNSFWLSLVERFSKKLVGWKGALLSQAGKLQLLKASLQNLPIYTLSLLKIPDKFADAIEKIQKRFLWLGVEEKKRLPLIGWNLVCRPKKAGGLGLRRIRMVNKILLAKKIWRIFSSSREWTDIMANKYLENNRSFIILKDSHLLPRGSTCWNNLINGKNIMELGTGWQVRNINHTRFWEDRWLFKEPLVKINSFNEWAENCKARYGIYVKDYRVNGKWVDLCLVSQTLAPIQSSFLAIRLCSDQLDDRLVWLDEPSGIIFFRLLFPGLLHLRNLLRSGRRLGSNI